MKKIAILGATGYIGRSLLPEFYNAQDKVSLFLFSRSKGKVKSLIKGTPKGFDVNACSYDELNEGSYDVIINCAGIGDPSVLRKNPTNIFKVTEEIDTLVIAYLIKKPNTLYINLSSGAVYGDNFKKSINHNTKSIVNVNSLSISGYYSIAKINSEAKHRAFNHLNIVDLRVFSFFSRFVDIDAGFLMSEIIVCLKKEKIFETNEDNIFRDYITSKDLFSLLQLIIKKGKINDFFDVYSKKPVSKFDLLASLKNKYGLEYKVKRGTKTDVSLLKNIYYSENKKAEILGYSPEFSSLKGIEYEIDKMV